MAARLVRVILAVAVGTAVLFFYGRMRADQIEAERQAALALAEEIHYVTPEMEAMAESLTSTEAPDFQLVGNDGQSYQLSEIVRDRPVVLVFIKDECPCSASADPFFAALYQQFGEKAQFLGLIDGTREVAQLWIDEHGTPYPILADPLLETMTAYNVPSSAHVAVIQTDGTIAKMFPGYWVAMLRDISSLLEETTGIVAEPISTEEAPITPYTGCPFPIEGATEDDEYRG